jgi:NAD(P)-dependent dehydrogenase (short-subunit alcohol dehydrogenase family)
VSGRVAVVTGGASGIGAGISRRLADDGHRVVIFDVVAAEETAAAIGVEGRAVVGLTVDVTDRGAIESAADRVRSELGPPTILINCAGRSAWGDFLEISAEDWRTAIAINLTGTFHCCQVFLPDMLDAGWGRIVNISSSSIHSGVPRLAPYVSAKWGIVGLTKSLSLEFAPHGITVNTVPPGFIDTPATRRSEARGFISFEASLKQTPVGRVGLPDDVGIACAFLVSEAASYITGQIIPVNGGRASTEP